MNTGETKDDVFTRSARHAQRIENENKFSQFGNTHNTQNTKLMRRLKTLKQEQDQKQKATMALEKSNMANIDDEEDKEGSYWIVDRSTCETTEQQCVLWHFIRCCLGVGMVWGAVELSLNGLPSARNGGEIIPILLGVIGGMLMIHSFKTLWKDYTKGLCPCQEVLNKQEMYDGQHNQGNDLEASISLAHARANQLNRAAMELPTVKDIEKRSHNNNNNKKSIKNKTDVGVVKGVDGEGNSGIVNDDPSYSNSSGSYYSSEDDEDENSSSDDDVMERSQPYTDRKHNITKTSDKDNDNDNDNDNNGQGETKIEKQSPTERTNNNGWTNEVVTEATTEVTATWEDTSDEEDISTSFDQLEQRLASKSKKSETRKKKKKKKKKKIKKIKKNKLSVNIQRRPGSGIGMIPRKIPQGTPQPPKQ